MARGAHAALHTIHRGVRSEIVQDAITITVRNRAEGVFEVVQEGEGDAQDIHSCPQGRSRYGPRVRGL